MEGPDAADRLQDTLSEHQEVIRAIEPAVADHLRLLLPLDKAWQPTDYLPDLEMESWRDEIERFRTAAEAVSDELLVAGGRHDHGGSAPQLRDSAQPDRKG